MVRSTPKQVAINSVVRDAWKIIDSANDRAPVTGGPDEEVRFAVEVVATYDADALSSRIDELITSDNKTLRQFAIVSVAKVFDDTEAATRLGKIARTFPAWWEGGLAVYQLETMETPASLDELWRISRMGGEIALAALKALRPSRAVSGPEIAAESKLAGILSTRDDALLLRLREFVDANPMYAPPALRAHVQRFPADVALLIPTLEHAAFGTPSRLPELLRSSDVVRTVYGLSGFVDDCERTVPGILSGHKHRKDIADYLADAAASHRPQPGESLSDLRFETLGNALRSLRQLGDFRGATIAHQVLTDVCDGKLDLDPSTRSAPTAFAEAIRSCAESSDADHKADILEVVRAFSRGTGPYDWQYGKGTLTAIAHFESPTTRTAEAMVTVAKDDRLPFVRRADALLVLHGVEAKLAITGPLLTRS